MAYKERINPKTGKKEYKYRYYFMADGKRKDSETAWFTSLEKARQEANLLKSEKTKADEHNRLQRRDKKLSTVFEEFLIYMNQEAKKELSLTDKKIYSTAKAIYSKHMANHIKEIRIKDIETITFKIWLTNINCKEEISGSYIRVCKEVLFRFNDWLEANNYYNSESFHEDVKGAIGRTKIKKKSYGNKEDKGERNVVTILDIEKITKYYFEEGLEDFENFYYYTLFYVLFYSGVRVEELCALQWKNVDLRSDYRTISIVNAISEKESRKHAETRIEEEQNKLKNKTSIRIIPIFDFYYELLVDYKESYMYYYDLDKEEMNDCFVFPSISKNNNPHKYFINKNVRLQLKDVIKKVGIKNTDLQMFRHSCATFLILPPPEGLGLVEERVKDYFGHQDTTMLNRVYAKLNPLQKSTRMKKETFTGLYNPTNSNQKSKEEIEREKLIDRIKGNNQESFEARKTRIISQIEKAIEEGRTYYFYMNKDEKIISECKEKYENDITFIIDD